MQRKFVNFIALLISSAIVYVLALPMMRDASGGGSPSCASTLKRAYNACSFYAIENEGFPEASHWMDRIILQDPMPLKCDKVEEGYGYAFNDRYSSVAIPNASEAKVLIYESTKLGRNEHDRVESLPKPGRHNGGSNVVFADGTAEFRN